MICFIVTYAGKKVKVFELTGFWLTVLLSRQIFLDDLVHGVCLSPGGLGAEYFFHLGICKDRFSQVSMSQPEYVMLVDVETIDFG
jgi:hypothetical protein